jgi:two-component system response regulator QseB
MHLLLIEDDLDLGASLQRALAAHGFTSVWVRTLREAKSHVREATADHFACAILDLGLTDGDGLSLLEAWRKEGHPLPVIVLTARDALASRVALLEAGADDYVIKPVQTEELASRVRAVTRRAAGRASARWNVADLQVDLATREVTVDAQPVHLSPKEFAVLAELARHAGSVVPKHRVAQALAPLGEPLEFNDIEWHVHNLRRKLGNHTIRTVRGVGYILQE